MSREKFAAEAFNADTIEASALVKIPQVLSGLYSQINWEIPLTEDVVAKAPIGSTGVFETTQIVLAPFVPSLNVKTGGVGFGRTVTVIVFDVVEHPKLPVPE